MSSSTEFYRVKPSSTEYYRVLKKLILYRNLYVTSAFLRTIGNKSITVLLSKTANIDVLVVLQTRESNERKRTATKRQFGIKIKMLRTRQISFLFFFFV